MPLYRPKLRRKVNAGQVSGAAAIVANANLAAAGSVVGQATSTTILRVTLGNFDNYGLGPGDVGAPQPIYRAAGPYAPTPSTIDADLDLAVQYDVMPIFNLGGTRTVFAPGGVYSESIMFSQIDRFRNHPKLTTAVNAQKVAFMAIDEPQHPDFGTPSTCTPTNVNNIGKYIKSIWPGAICYSRQTGELLVSGGWSNINNESVPPAGGWSGLDYCNSMYAWNQQRVAVAAYFPQQKTLLAQGGLGLICGFNFFNAGNWQDLAGLTPVCWDIENDGIANHFGVIIGTQDGGSSTFPDGTHLLCGDPQIGGVGTKFFVPSPAMLRAFADAAMADPAYAPFTTGFGYANTNTALTKQWEIDLQRRADTVAALRYAVNLGLTRSQGTWRPIKP